MVKVSPNHLTRVKNVFLNGFIELCPKMRIARRGKIPRRKLIFKPSCSGLRYLCLRFTPGCWSQETRE